MDVRNPCRSGKGLAPAAQEKRCVRDRGQRPGVTVAPFAGYSPLGPGGVAGPRVSPLLAPAARLGLGIGMAAIVSDNADCKAQWRH